MATSPQDLAGALPDPLHGSQAANGPPRSVAVPATEPPPRRWQRYLRFSVRAMLVLVLAVGGALGWWIVKVRTQRDAVRAIQRAGGSVDYEEPWSDNDRRERGLWTRRWIADNIGIDSLANVNRVWFYGKSRFTDAVLAEIGRLRWVQRLGLDETAVSDGALAHLEGLTNLSFLHLHSTKVGDAGLAHLAGLSDLAHLDLRETQVTDAGLAHLKGLIHLKFLFLGGTQVTDAGLAHLTTLTELRELELRGTRVTGSGLGYLRALPSLQRLDLRGTPIRGSELIRLKDLPGLTIVFLHTDPALDAGVTELRKAVPALRIDRPGR
jgi:hypothetical protein